MRAVTYSVAGVNAALAFFGRYLRSMDLRLFRDAFDERFDAVAAKHARVLPMHIGVLLLLSVTVGVGVGWTPAAILLLSAVLVELGLWRVFRTIGQGGPYPRAYLWLCVGGYFATAMIWCIGAFLLWRSDSPACQVTAVGVFAGALLHVTSNHARSLGALAPKAPQFLGPILAPLIWPHFTGRDQLLVQAILLALVAHGLLCCLMSLRDSADTKAAGRQLALARDHAEGANRAKSVFLATMSHEIRTPLNGVLGMAQAIAADSKTPRRVRDQVAVIQQSGEALLAILNDILDLSRVEAGKLELELIPFNLAELAFGARETFAPIARAKDLALELTITEGAQGFYMGDPTRLRQILYNLISNALKFTEAGAVTVELARDEQGLRVTVSDSGIGIEAAQLGRLFSKFEQADVSTTRRYGGAGLGLSICRELVGLMGGVIEAQSEPGRGSHFSVRVPIEWMGAAPAVDAPTPQIRVEPTRLDRPLRLLAAEDNNVNQLVLTILLAQIGMEPVIVADGAAAVRAWEEGPWDLILMDIQMPVMDGPTATQAIRAAEAATGRARTPILALTANAMSHQVAEYLSIGMDGHVAKPIDAASLYVAVERVLGRDLRASAAAA